MYGNKSEPPQHWSVHAEFTISHPGANDPDNLPQTATVHRDDGVRMTYTWTANDGNPSNPPSESASNRSLYSDVGGKHYGFQRGNLFFTSTPSRTVPEVVRRAAGVQDSGYGSDLLSPNSLQSGSLPRRVAQPYNRKCRSTCNITLSTNIQERNSRESSAESTHSQPCGRTQSLRCQTPAVRCERQDTFYGCGDPWCHHLHFTDEFSCTGKISPVPETCEDVTSSPSTKRASRTSTYTAGDRGEAPGGHSVGTVPVGNRPAGDPVDRFSIGSRKKDASVQTFEMIDKCTSPFMKMDSFNYYNKSPQPFEKATERTSRKYSAFRRKTEPISRSPGSYTPDSLDSLKPPTRRLTRSPMLQRIPAIDRTTSKEPSPSDSLKKPRTVHIDVYCTGTEQESDASSSSDSSDNKTASTPQTVFESDKVRITHKKADEKQLPFHLTNRLNPQSSKSDNTSLEKDESDDENASTSYPSKMSSYSTIGDLSASISSVPHSWTTYSMSSCTVPDDYDSIANTSWKDTFSDIESLLQSRSSIAPTDSLDFVPRKLYEKNASIDETPEFERKDLLETPSNASIQPSDSFEYANSEDRLRIKRMEETWKGKSQQNPWRSPKSERTLMLQQKRMQEYMERKLQQKNSPKWESKDSESEDSDGSGKGWTFVKPDDKKVKRDSILRRPETVQNKPEGPLQEPSAESKSFVVNRQPLLRKSAERHFGPQEQTRFPRSLQQTKSPTEKPVVGQSSSVAKPVGASEKEPSAFSTGVQTKSPTVAPKHLVQNLQPPKSPKVKPLQNQKRIEDQGSLSDSSPPSPTSPTSAYLRQRLSLDPNLRSPFTIVPGIYSEPRSIAQKFGSIVNVVKKPGHHIGPAKNPDCLCDHCTRYRENMGYRNRTRSVGDPPTSYIQNWKEFLENQKDDSRRSGGVKQPFTDF